MSISFPSWFAGRLKAVIFLLIFLAAFGSTWAQRLPETVLPTHYALTLTPDLNAATFAGAETIDVMVKRPVRSITLNAAEITFQSVQVAAGGSQQTANVSINREKQQATFTFANALPAGNATLTIHYTGILNGELRGFYLSKTEKRNYAVTQFEPTDARRAFPSFDEPAMKATFDISLMVDDGDTGISNGPIVSDTPGPEAGKHTLRFQTTPRMSTYLVAFLVGDFQCSSGQQDGVALQVCSTPDKVALTRYGLGIAKYALHYFNDYFDIPYPLKKLDLIAIPDFEAGAMENFGAITFRETDLLVDPKTATDGALENVGLVIAHEMAHQWFGDLVTMQWWNNLWLNEGFATWMENKPIAQMHPEWNIDQLVANSKTNTLDLDAQPSTRAIRAKADTPDQINQMFDGIAYGKASDVLLTVENYVGPEVFRKGVHEYLKAHLNGNATAEDFWNAQTRVSNKPVDKIMNSLVAQPGVPILTFGEPHNGQVSVQQQRFFLSPNMESDPSQKWTLPVCFKTDAGQSDCQVLTPETSKLKVPASRFLFADAAGKGYYRTAYPADVRNAILAKIETALTPPERIGFTGDQWAQMRSDKLTAGDYLDLAAALKSDPNAHVLSVAVGGVDAIVERIAVTPEQRGAMAAWIRRTYSPELKKLGPPLPSDTPNKDDLRTLLFEVLGEYGEDPEVLSQAGKIAEEYIADPASAEPALGQAALYIAAMHGDAKLFDKLQHIYETSSDPVMRETALHLLGMFEDPRLIRRSLDYAISGKVRNQDAAIQLSVSLGMTASRDIAWDYIKSHWDSVKAQMTTELGSYLVAATASFCSVEKRDDVQDFFSTHELAATSRALNHAIERINGCVEFRKLQEPNLNRWLAAQQNP